MQHSRYRSKDLWAGLLFTTIGIAALLISQDYPLGTPRRMGPGFFPTILGWLLVALGLAIALRPGQSFNRPSLREVRPFLTIAAVVVFAVIVDRVGVVVSTCALVVVNALGSPVRSWIETLALALALSAFVTVVFVYGLGLPLKVCP